MSNVHFEAHVNEDGSLTLPAFAVRGLGFVQGDQVSFTVPEQQPECDPDCFHDELFVTRTCGDDICPGYTTTGAQINIPPQVFAQANVPLGTDLTMIAGDGVLVLVAGTEACEDIDLEIECMLDELGIGADHWFPHDIDF